MTKARTSIHGVGINDADYKTSDVKTKTVDGKRVIISRWECHFYSTWRNMLMRCYCEKYQRKNRSYIGASVCSEWFSFSAFRAWMKSQDFEGKHLDKDLLSGSVYSPETCLFIEPRVNYFIRDLVLRENQTSMIGACFDKSRNKWISSCSSAFGKVVRLGRFNTELEAHQAWKAEKLKQAKLLADSLADKRVAALLVARYQ